METRCDLFEFVQRTEGNNSSKTQHVQKNLNKMFECEQYRNIILDSIKQFIYRVSSEMSKRWKISNKTKVGFYKNNSVWSNKPIHVVPKNVVNNSDGETFTFKGVRSETQFKSCSERSKRRKTEIIPTCIPKSELTYATTYGFTIIWKKRRCKKLLRATTTVTPTRVFKKGKCRENKIININSTRVNEN